LQSCASVRNQSFLSPMRRAPRCRRAKIAPRLRKAG
jgi:hypothetical protein